MSAQERTCCICQGNVEREDPDILTVGSYGTPRVLCDECSGRLSTMTESKEADAIREAMERLNRDLLETGCDDPVVQGCMDELFRSAADRAERIRNGTYDQSEEKEEEEIETEDLSETEEDRELDRLDEERDRKIGKIITVIEAVVLVAVLVFLIKRFFF